MCSLSGFLFRLLRSCTARHTGNLEAHVGGGLRFRLAFLLLFLGFLAQEFRQIVQFIGNFRLDAVVRLLHGHRFRLQRFRPYLFHALWL